MVCGRNVSKAIYTLCCFHHHESLKTLSINISDLHVNLITNIMANQVKTPIQNYFEKVLYENLTFEIPPLCRGIKKNRNKPLWLWGFL
jgi:hypothetical protein